MNYRQYLYKNETLLNFLELDWEEAESLELQSIFKPKTKEERNKDYYVKSLKRKDILKVLDISPETYKRDRNNLKEQGLI